MMDRAPGIAPGPDLNAGRRRMAGSLGAQVAAIVAARGAVWLQPGDFGAWVAPSEGATPALVTSNGVPALRFLGTGQRMQAVVDLTGWTAATAVVAVASIAPGEAAYLLSQADGAAYLGWVVDASTGAFAVNAGSPLGEVDDVAVANRDELHDGLADNGKHLGAFAPVNFSTWTGLWVGSALGG